jgi:hypothetical protein
VYPNSVDLRKRQQQDVEAVNGPDFHFKVWGFALAWQCKEDLDCPEPISSTHHHAEKLGRRRRQQPIFMLTISDNFKTLEIECLEWVDASDFEYFPYPALG